MQAKKQLGLVVGAVARCVKEQGGQHEGQEHGNAAQARHRLCVYPALGWLVQPAISKADSAHNKGKQVGKEKSARSPHEQGGNIGQQGEQQQEWDMHDDRLSHKSALLRYQWTRRFPSPGGRVRSFALDYSPPFKKTQPIHGMLFLSEM